MILFKKKCQNHYIIIRNHEHPSSWKPITVVTHPDEVFLKYKTICFTDGSKLDGGVGLVCVIYESQKSYFLHGLMSECSVF